MTTDNTLEAAAAAAGKIFNRAVPGDGCFGDYVATVTDSDGRRLKFSDLRRVAVHLEVTTPAELFREWVQNTLRTLVYGGEKQEDWSWEVNEFWCTGCVGFATRIPHYGGSLTRVVFVTEFGATVVAPSGYNINDGNTWSGVDVEMIIQKLRGVRREVLLD